MSDLRGTAARESKNYISKNLIGIWSYSKRVSEKIFAAKIHFQAEVVKYYVTTLLNIHLMHFLHENGYKYAIC
jgi:hypothetical protein